MSDFTPRLHADATSYLSSRFRSDMSDLSYADTVDIVAKAYSGGWAAYKADFYAMVRRIEGGSESMSPVRTKAALQHMTGVKLGDHDTIDEATFSDTMVKFVFTTYKVREGVRIDRMTSRTTWLYVATRVSPFVDWSDRMVDVTEACAVEYVKY